MAWPGYENITEIIEAYSRRMKAWTRMRKNNSSVLFEWEIKLHYKNFL